MRWTFFCSPTYANVPEFRNADMQVEIDFYGTFAPTDNMESPHWFALLVKTEPDAITPSPQPLKRVMSKPEHLKCGFLLSTAAFAVARLRLED